MLFGLQKLEALSKISAHAAVIRPSSCSVAVISPLLPGNWKFMLKACICKLGSLTEVVEVYLVTGMISAVFCSNFFLLEKLCLLSCVFVLGLEAGVGLQ